MKSETHDALEAHMKKWRKGKGFNANPFGEIEEKFRWICARIDAQNEAKAKAGRRLRT